MSRRFQFSLRALLGTTALVAAFFGGSRFGAKQEQQRLATEMKSAQEKITHDADALMRAHKILRTLRGNRSEEARRAETEALRQLKRRLRETKP